MITRMVRAVLRQAPAMASAAVAVLWAGAALPAAGIDAFLKIESSAGQVVDTDATHSWVELFGFSQGVETEILLGSATGGAGGGKMHAKTCTLKMAQDRSMVSLLNACAKGERRNLTLQVAREQAGKYQVMTELLFEDAFVTSVKCDMTREGDKPVFDVELVYLKLTWTTIWYDTTGKNATARGVGFDFAENDIFETTSTVPALGDYAGGTTPPNPDADGDGMLDAWETANGLSPTSAADATQDRDKDGRSNKDEFLAGTNPNSGASFFRMSVSSAAAGQVKLTWNSAAGTSYKVWAAQSPGSFTLIATVPGVAGETSYTTALTGGRYFKVTTGE